MSDAPGIIDAAKQGDLARIEALLAADSALAAARADSGETPLMAALYRGHHSIVDALLAAGAPVDVFAAAALGRRDDLVHALRQSPDAACERSYDGWTPLHLAAFFGHREAAALLTSHGADLQARSQNSLQNTPLHAAVAGGHVDVSLFLIEQGAGVEVADAGGHTPLHIAAEAGYVPVVEALLARGADPLAVDLEQKTPLARAAARNHDEVIDLLNKRI
ncbi:MAG TPA: ankyrin repeat domain-containing protein [Vicinamibacterales bacterium]|nr:ankyrin repeat domain-containing protein [Vicinamibacterales bacterium]